MPDLPKLSYVLLSHNREKYIRTAIESAFAQDYEGELEYIFSDDCSTDRTFEIIKECVAAYKGNRRVVVTQTPRNLHLAGNTNHAVQFATGDFVIRADDDDISCIDRCSIIGNALAEYPEATYIFALRKHFTDVEESECILTSRQRRDNNEPLETFDIRNNDNALDFFCKANCLHQAWATDIYRKFQPIPLDGYNVDDLISLYRAAVLGKGIFINTVVAYIRDGSTNMCRGGDDGSSGYKAIIRREVFNDNYLNITYRPLKETVEEVSAYLHNNNITAPHFEEIIKADLAKRDIEKSYWRKGTLNRLRINRALRRTSGYDFIRSLPMPIYAALLHFIKQVKSLFS